MEEGRWKMEDGKRQKNVDYLLKKSPFYINFFTKL